MRRALLMMSILLSTGCQIDPYTHEPTWSERNWYQIGADDAMAGGMPKSAQRLSREYDDPRVDIADYKKGYARGQQRLCQDDFVYVWGLSGKEFPGACENLKETSPLRARWKEGYTGASENSLLN
ncbi:DUF2799 domain-containing protein [Atlantibacter sp.]|uniref:DUF2799 domain-containing protein n=1 Tax=Atlantibacter sp. TaxID=1903473 RepID=UPI00289F0810|nr:DUF2799 domain-containing protein [Atlantibacter sp.]